jgi:hypothetical protein
MGNLITETPYSEITATMELLDRLGVGRDDLKRFRKSSSRVKAEVAQLIKGKAMNGIIIDCDAQPFTPDGWSVEEHQKGGTFTWDKETQKDALYLSKGQQGGKYIEGNKLRKEMAGKPVLNANVLDYLLKNPHLIPEEWKGKYVFFWGTVYRHRVGDLCVRCLYWDGGRWRWSSYWLDLDWSGYRPAALRAS